MAGALADDSDIQFALNLHPVPFFIKAADLRYICVNTAYEQMFAIFRSKVIGRTDIELYVDRQAVQCAGGDMRVLETGMPDEAPEVMSTLLGPRKVVTRKQRLETGAGERFLIGALIDVTPGDAHNPAIQRACETFNTQAKELLAARRKEVSEMTVMELALRTLVGEPAFLAKPDMLAA